MTKFILKVVWRLWHAYLGLSGHLDVREVNSTMLSLFLARSRIEKLEESLWAHIIKHNSVTEFTRESYLVLSNLFEDFPIQPPVLGLDYEPEIGRFSYQWQELSPGERLEWFWAHGIVSDEGGTIVHVEEAIPDPREVH